MNRMGDDEDEGHAQALLLKLAAPKERDGRPAQLPGADRVTQATALLKELSSILDAAVKDRANGPEAEGLLTRAVLATEAAGRAWYEISSTADVADRVNEILTVVLEATRNDGDPVEVARAALMAIDSRFGLVRDEHLERILDQWSDATTRRRGRPSLGDAATSRSDLIADLLRRARISVATPSSTKRALKRRKIK